MEIFKRYSYKKCLTFNVIKTHDTEVNCSSINGFFYKFTVSVNV